jgi:hypothetical protein
MLRAPDVLDSRHLLCLFLAIGVPGECASAGSRAQIAGAGVVVGERRGRWRASSVWALPSALALATRACSHDDIENQTACVGRVYHDQRRSWSYRARALLLPLRLSLRGGALPGPSGDMRGGAGGAGAEDAPDRKLYPLLLRGLSGLREEVMRPLCGLFCGQEPACVCMHVHVHLQHV